MLLSRFSFKVAANVPPIQAVAYFTHGILQIYRKDLKIKRDEKRKKYSLNFINNNQV